MKKNPYDYEKKPAENHLWSMIRDGEANVKASRESLAFNERRLEGFKKALHAIDPTYR